MNKPWLERTAVPAKTRAAGEHQPRHDSGKLLVHLPDGGLTNLPWLRACVGKGVPITPATHEGEKVWSLSTNHMLKLTAAMADRYGEVELRLGISRLTKCSRSCQSAKPETVFDCVCACGGEHHSGEGTYSDWYQHGFRLVREGDVEVRAITIERGQIQLPEWTPPKFRSARRSVPVPPPTAPVRPALRLVPPPPLPTPRPPVVSPMAVTPNPGTSSPVRVHRPDLGAVRAHRQGPAAGAAGTVATRPSVVMSRRRWPSVATAIGALLGIGMLLWLILPDHDDQQPGEASTPAPAQHLADTPVAPQDAVAAPEPTPQPAPARRAPGCYPFQADC